MKSRSLILLLGIFIGIFSFNVEASHAEQIERRAIITNIEGSVLVQPAGQAVSLPASVGEELKKGDRIITGSDGRAEIKLDEGSVSRISPNSRVQIEALYRESYEGSETTFLNVDWGRVWNKVQDVLGRNSRFEVNTPSAVAGVRGTAFLVDVQESDDTVVRVYGGTVGVKPPAARTTDDTGAPAGDADAQEIVVNPYQQASMRSDAPPPAEPEPVDVMAVDDWEKDNLVEDVPVAYVEVETEVKTIVVELMEQQVLAGRKALAELAMELEQLRALQQEAVGERLAELQRLESQLRKEMEIKRDIVREVDREREETAIEKERLNEVRERIRVAPPDVTPEELNEQIRQDAQTIRQEERERATERQERQQAREEREREAQEVREEASKSAETLGVSEELERARENVTPEIVEKISGAQSQEEFESVFVETFGEEYKDVMAPPSEEEPGGEEEEITEEQEEQQQTPRVDVKAPIVSVESLADMEVDFYTSREDIELPVQVGVTLGDRYDSIREIDVEWNEGSPAYNGEKAGEYVFTGTLVSLPDDIVNFENLKAELKVIVKPYDMVNIKSLFETHQTGLLVYADGVNREDLEKARELIDALQDEAVRNQLHEELTSLVSEVEVSYKLIATKKVVDLFDNYEFKIKLASDIEKDDIDIASSYVENLDEGEKEELQKDIHIAYHLLEGNFYRVFTAPEDPSHPALMDITGGELLIEADGSFNFDVQLRDLTGASEDGTYRWIVFVFLEGKIMRFFVDSNSAEIPEEGDLIAGGIEDKFNIYTVGNNLKMSGQLPIELKPEEIQFVKVFTSYTGQGSDEITVLETRDPQVLSLTAGELGEVIVLLRGGFPTENSFSELKIYDDQENTYDILGAESISGGEFKLFFEAEYDTEYTFIFDEGFRASFEQTVMWDIGIPAGYIPVATAEELNSIRENLAGKYILVADIDLSQYLSEGGEGYNDGAGWEPIGKYVGWSDSDNIPFIGTFDGNGKVISGLTINRPETDGVGLFGYTEAGAEFVNIALEHVNVAGGQFVGGLVGFNRGGSITASSVTGNVTAARDVGGLVGYSEEGVIADSYATADVEAHWFAGGLVGTIYKEVIKNSYATGAVTGSRYIGGLAGGQALGVIENSYATGVVTATSDAGGLIGENFNSSVIDSYALNPSIISAGNSTDNFGRIIGRDVNSITLSGNMANYNMIEPFDGAFNEKTHDGKDGADIYGWTISDGKIDLIVSEREEITGLDSIIGTPEIGQKLTVGAITPIGATVTFQWQRHDGTEWIDIAGENESTYTVAAPVEVGDEVRVVATGVGVYTGTVESAAVMITQVLQQPQEPSEPEVATGIMGIVTNETEVPIQNARVQVKVQEEVEDEDYYITHTVTLFSNHEGEFVINNYAIDLDFPAGIYTLKVFAPGYAVGTVADVEVNHEQMTDINVALQAVDSGNLSGVIREEGTNEVIEAAMVIMYMNGFEYFTGTNNNGEYSIEGIPVGSYTVKIIAAEYERFESNIEILNDTEVKADFTLTKQLTE